MTDPRHRRLRLHRLATSCRLRACPDGAEVVNLDKLTYAGNPANLADVADDEALPLRPRPTSPTPMLVAGARSEGCDAVVNFAAESHVDRAILEPADFIQTDVVGTYGAARRGPADRRRPLRPGLDRRGVRLDRRTGTFTETDPLAPDPARTRPARPAATSWCSPAHRTFGLDAVITRGSNNYGPYQYPEKLIPLFVTNLLDGEPLPVYGDGMQIRDWIHVEDHCDAASGRRSTRRGRRGLQHRRRQRVAQPRDHQAHPRAHGRATRRCIRYVKDRPGHDRRYAIDTEQAARARLGARADVRRRPRSTVAVVPRQPSRGGGRSRAASTASTTTPSTAVADNGFPQRTFEFPRRGDRGPSPTCRRRGCTRTAGVANSSFVLLRST